MLGEELWISRRPRDAAALVSAATSAAALGAVLAARRHRLRPALIAVAVQMALTLVYWQQMVRYLERQRRIGRSRDLTLRANENTGIDTRTR